MAEGHGAAVDRGFQRLLLDCGHGLPRCRGLRCRRDLPAVAPHGFSRRRDQPQHFVRLGRGLHDLPLGGHDGDVCRGRGHRFADRGIIEFIHRQSRVKTDAAICIAFTTLFAAGVVLLSVAEMQGPVHLDAECVLYGEIAFVPLDPAVEVFGLVLGPAPVVRIAGVLVGLLVLAMIFYKELLVTSFDPALARSLGIRAGVWHYGLMAVLSIVIVSVFEAVGAILAVAMLVVPPMFAAQLSDRLPVRFALVFLHAALSSLLGYQLSVWLNCSPAGAMVVVGAMLFLLAWAVTRPRRAAFPGWTAPS
jgi:ABC-type Mn2+/Zn2+ transport system permease subunit